MKLYFSPGACSLSPHIVLREAGIAADLEQVDLKTKKTKSGADFTAVNPKGQVPTLVLDSGQTLTEGPAIVQYLADQKAYLEQTKIERESLRADAARHLSGDYTDEIEAHFDLMPDNYFRASGVPEIVMHLKLFRSFLENVSGANDRPLAPAISWDAFPKQGHTIFSICTWDRPHLLAKIAGSFSIVPINILSADIFPRWREFDRSA